MRQLDLSTATCDFLRSRCFGGRGFNSDHWKVSFEEFLACFHLAASESIVKPETDVPTDLMAALLKTARHCAKRRLLHHGAPCPGPRADSPSPQPHAPRLKQAANPSTERARPTSTEWRWTEAPTPLGDATPSAPPCGERQPSSDATGRSVDPQRRTVSAAMERAERLVRDAEARVREVGASRIVSGAGRFQLHTEQPGCLSCDGPATPLSIAQLPAAGQLSGDAAPSSATRCESAQQARSMDSESPPQATQVPLFYHMHGLSVTVAEWGVTELAKGDVELWA